MKCNSVLIITSGALGIITCANAQSGTTAGVDPRAEMLRQAGERAKHATTEVITHTILDAAAHQVFGPAAVMLNVPSDVAQIPRPAQTGAAGSATSPKVDQGPRLMYKH